VTSLKKTLLGKKSVTKNRNIMFKGKEHKSRYHNWNKTWDFLHSMFMGWFLRPRFPAYTCHFLVPRLHGMCQSTSGTTCSQSDRGGPSSSPSQQPLSRTLLADLSCPFVCGCSTEANICFIPSSMHSFPNCWLANWVPWLDTKCLGIPKWHTIFFHMKSWTLWAVICELA